MANICQQTYKHPVHKKMAQVTYSKLDASKNPQSSSHDENQYV
jgi:hypothetical protein